MSYGDAKMKRKDFKSLVSQLNLLTYSQKQKLIKELTPNAENESIELIESYDKSCNSCPHCRSKKLHKWGKANGLQRYRCRLCSKTFNGLTDTSLSKLQHKEKWLIYAQCMAEGKSIRQSGKICQIDPKTAFRWRHRFLSPMAKNESTKMTGIVEADETFFSENCKGSREIKHRKPKKRGASTKKLLGERIPVLIIRDRTGTEADFVFLQIEKEAIHNSLRPLMGEEIVLCTDGNSIYETFAKEEKILHKRIVSLDGIRVVEEIFHIQNLNAYISRLKSWIRQFHGVATKYLENYLGWRRTIEMKNVKVSAKFYLQRALRKNYQQVMQT